MADNDSDLNALRPDVPRCDDEDLTLPSVGREDLIRGPLTGKYREQLLRLRDKWIKYGRLPPSDPPENPDPPN